MEISSAPIIAIENRSVDHREMQMMVLLLLSSSFDNLNGRSSDWLAIADEVVPNKNHIICVNLPITQQILQFCRLRKIERRRYTVCHFIFFFFFSYSFFIIVSVSFVNCVCAACCNINKTQLWWTQYNETKNVLPAQYIKLTFTHCTAAADHSVQRKKLRWIHICIWKCCWARQHSLRSLIRFLFLKCGFVVLFVRLFVCVLCCALLCLKSNEVGSAYRRATVKSKQTSKEYQLLHSSCSVRLATSFPFVRRVFLSLILSSCVYGRVFPSHHIDKHTRIRIRIYIFFLWTHCLD